MKTVYQELATLIDAYHRCCSPSANESQQSFAPKHEKAIEAIVKRYLPSGSGLDAMLTGWS